CLGQPFPLAPFDGVGEVGRSAGGVGVPPPVGARGRGAAVQVGAQRVPGGGRVRTDDRQAAGPRCAADLRGVGDVVQERSRPAPVPLRAQVQVQVQVQVGEGAVGQFVGAQPGGGREQSEVHPFQAEVAQRHGDRYVVGAHSEQRGQFAAHRVPVPQVQEGQHVSCHAGELVVVLGGQDQDGGALGRGRGRGGGRGGLLDDEV